MLGQGGGARGDVRRGEARRSGAAAAHTPAPSTQPPTALAGAPGSAPPHRTHGLGFRISELRSKVDAKGEMHAVPFGLTQHGCRVTVSPVSMAGLLMPPGLVRPDMLADRGRFARTSALPPAGTRSSSATGEPPSHHRPGYPRWLWHVAVDSPLFHEAAARWVGLISSGLLAGLLSRCLPARHQRQVSHTWQSPVLRLQVTLRSLCILPPPPLEEGVP